MTDVRGFTARNYSPVSCCLGSTLRLELQLQLVERVAESYDASTLYVEADRQDLS